MQTEQLKNIVTEIQSSVDVLNSRMKGMDGKKISELKDRTIETTQFAKQRENRLKK